MVQLGLDLSVTNHSGRICNSLSTFGLLIKSAALCHSIFVEVAREAVSHILAGEGGLEQRPREAEPTSGEKSCFPSLKTLYTNMSY